MSGTQAQYYHILLQGTVGALDACVQILLYCPAFELFQRLQERFFTLYMSKVRQNGLRGKS